MLAPICRAYVQQVFAAHGFAASTLIREQIVNERKAGLLTFYFLSIYTIGVIDTEAFDYLIGGNGRRCIETPISRLTTELNHLFTPVEKAPLHGTMYNNARTAFWCREIIQGKTPEKVLEFKQSHAIANGLKLSHPEYLTLVLPRWRTLFAPELITLEKVVAAMK